MAGGADIFLAFIIVFLFAVVYGLYTARGSGISQHPYGNRYHGAPLAYRQSFLSGRDEIEAVRWSSRGMR